MQWATLWQETGPTRNRADVQWLLLPQGAKSWAQHTQANQGCPWGRRKEQHETGHRKKGLATESKACSVGMSVIQPQGSCPGVLHRVGAATLQSHRPTQAG